MLGVLYLTICIAIGSVIIGFACPKLVNMTRTTYTRERVFLSPWFILLPAWFVSGILVMTWFTYGLAYFFRDAAEPLGIANSILIPTSFFVSVAGIYNLYGKDETKMPSVKGKFCVSELIFVAVLFLLAVALMWSTFFVKDGKIYVGNSVFSDFSPHLGMIRSFSYGNNFPTSYSHYAGEDIRYHFLFQFLVGNLEYLGMRIDFAFNLPSVLSFVFVGFLLYATAVKLTGKRAVGYFACLFWIFRSSNALFDFLAEVPKGTSLLQALKDNTEFIGTTPNESWGIWNLNVYCNQRHLAIGICLLLLLVYYYLGHLVKSSQRINLLLADKGEMRYIERIKYVLKLSLFSKEGWMVKKKNTAVWLGILLGAGAFFNGSCVVACLSILFVIALASDRRLEFLITAVIAMTLSALETSFFVNGSVISPQFFFGFIAPVKTLFGVWKYIFDLLGILPIVLIGAALVVNKTHKWIMAAFLTPFVIAFTLSLTTDVTVNHKYVMLSVMLFGIFAAMFTVFLWERRGLLTKIVCVGLVITMTITGFYEMTLVFKKNDSKEGRCLVFNVNDPITMWVKKNATSQDIFLTPYYSINNFVLGGAMLFQGWPYYAWSAGYDTVYRDVIVKEMYEAATPEELDALAKAHNIRYIVVDYDTRTSTEYSVNEGNIRETYQEVYNNAETAGYGEWTIYIYDTHLRVK